MILYSGSKNIWVAITSLLLVLHQEKYFSEEGYSTPILNLPDRFSADSRRAHSFTVCRGNKSLGIIREGNLQVCKFEDSKRTSFGLSFLVLDNILILETLAAALKPDRFSKSAVIF